MSESMASRILSKDMSKRSSFESALVGQNSGMGSYLEKQGYDSKKYAGKTQYQVPKTLKQGNYSGADDFSKLGSRRFQGADNKNKGLADRVFNAKQAREGSQKARQQDQVFSAADDRFKTSSVVDAENSQGDNNRPVIIKPDGGQTDETPYSEEEIRRMVNRR
jgi:hypothetical protein